MALVASNLAWPVEKLVEATLAFDASYPTGGEQILAQAFGLGQINRIEYQPTGTQAGGSGFVFYTTINTGGLSANVLVFNAPGSAGNLVQVANATNLAILTAVPVRVYGY